MTPVGTIEPPAVDAGAGPHSRIAVLVVEDSLDHRMLMERRLRDSGMQVRTAATAEEALESLDGVDLVLLDYRLPRVNGLDVLRTIREHPQAPSVVMVTGMGSTDVAVEAMREGAIDYLAKNPGYLQALPKVIERAWRHHDLARRAGELQRLAMLVHSATARDEVFHEIVSGAARLLGTRSCVLALAANGRLEAAASLGPDEGGLAAIGGVGPHDVADGEPRIVGDHLVVPLERESDEPVGALVLTTEGPRDYLEEELELAQVFASFAGIALRNLRRRELEEALIAELQQTMEARRDFVASVSHELRTPLTSISGYTETVVTHWPRLDDDQKVTFLRKVGSHARELSDLVDQLIDVAGLERGRTFRAELETLQLADEVATALASLESILEGRELHTDVESLAVVADPDLLRRTLSNLVSNAVKYSDPGSPIEVRGRRRDSAAEVAVTDHGIGLTPREAARVFDPFFRASHSVSNAIRGSGIGLSLVREYVRTMGGEVSVESTPGEGSTFVFTVPLAS